MTNLKQIENNAYINKDNVLNKKTKKTELTFPKRKINIFRVINSNTFFIFNRGEYDKYPRNMINDILQKRKKFKIFTFSKNLNKKYKKDRKNNSDNIRKKIKSRFLKYLRNIVNKRLYDAGSEMFFKILPQKFICNISKQQNRNVLNSTFKEVFSSNFFEEEIKEKCSIKKCNDNSSVLEYLENNEDIGEKSNYYYFKNMKYYEIFNEYLRSKEFETEIKRLEKKEDDRYIEKYIKLAYNLINFFYYE